MMMNRFFNIFLNIVARESRLAWRKRVDYLNPSVFFMLVATLFPLAMTPSQSMLMAMGPGVIWVAALLSCLLSMHKLFQEDYEDGSLVQLLMSHYSLALLVFLRVIVLAGLQVLPLMLIMPLLGLLYHLTPLAMAVLLLTLCLGIPLLYFMGSMIAALTVGLRNSGLLLALIVMPLTIPTLVFSTSAVNAVNQGISASAPLLFLSALLVLAATLAPIACAFTLRTI